MEKIVINGRFLLHRITGVERYARELLRELDKIVEPGWIILAIPMDVKEIPDYKNIKVKRIGKFHNRLWEHISFPIYVKKEKSISLNLCNVAPLISPGIVCLFDVKIKIHPEFFSNKFLYWYTILFSNATKRANIILTDSYSAKKDLMKYYPCLSDKKIYVIYPGWQHYERINYDEDTLSKYKLVKYNYFFAMGSMEPNKNFKWIAEIAKKNPNQIFAVAGSINKQVFKNGLGFICPENMKLLGYVSDEQAKTLMRDCKAFLFPTFYEGFGIPPLEAVSAGARQIVVSDTDVMHEIFEESAVYINPSIYEFGGNQLENNVDKWKILNKYSWEKSAEILLQILKSI